MSIPRGVHTVALGALVVLLLELFSPGSVRATANRSGPSATPSGSARCGPSPRLEPDDFPRAPEVENKFFPLVPGTEYTLQGSVGSTRHRIVTTVTDLTKTVDGVRAIVVFDRDLDGNRIQESELFFEAEDDHGAVWNLGEYPEEYDNGKLAGAPNTWIAGQRGARAGFSMLADPRAGGDPYLQGIAHRIGFEDCARVVKAGQRTCVPVGCYGRVLVTDEWAPRDPEGGHQRKFYAPGVGTVRVEPVGGVDPETLQLVSIRHLCGSALAEVRGEALEQDARGYRLSPDVYGHTSHARQTLETHHCARGM